MIGHRWTIKCLLYKCYFSLDSERLLPCCISKRAFVTLLAMYVTSAQRVTTVVSADHQLVMGSPSHFCASLFQTVHFYERARKTDLADLAVLSDIAYKRAHIAVY